MNLLKNNWLIISLIFLLISSYQVWLDIKKEKIGLEDKLKNPVDYEIKSYKQNIVVDVDYLENLFDEDIKKIDEILLSIDSEIKNLSNNDNIGTTNISKILSMRSNSLFPNNYKSDELYIQELKNYKTKLKEYPNKKRKFFISLGKFYKK